MMLVKMPVKKVVKQAAGQIVILNVLHVHRLVQQNVQDNVK